jgi:succinoglycan biosynthesis protein ExoO
MSDISVVITAYNIERYIERAVSSALAQKYVDVEILVVDDCSTDNTWSVVSTMTHPRIRPLRLERNGGPSAARNAGFAAATAPWIAVLDGDDAMEPERLHRMLARVRAEKADIVVDNLIVLRDRMQYPLFAPRKFSRLGTISLAAFIDGNRFFLYERAYGYLKPMFSADFLRQRNLSYNTTFRTGEDYFLMVEALACGAICAVEPTAGYRYTVRANSISRQQRFPGAQLIPGAEAEPDYSTTSLWKFANIEQLIACERTLLEHHVLNVDVWHAQRRRESSLRDAAHFCQLLNALKARDIGSALKIVAANPPAARHIWRPLWRAARRSLPFQS